MDPAEFEAYKSRHHRINVRIRWLVLAGCAALGLIVAFLWSFPGGLALACALELIGLNAQERWSKARWIRRFPELAAPTTRWEGRQRAGARATGTPDRGKR